MIKSIIKKIEEYIPYNHQEENDQKAMIAFLKNNKDAFDRNNLVGHMTSSSWIVNKERTKILMIYHNRYDSWSWTGGHADNDEDLLHVALKEAKEETSIKHIVPLSNEIFSLELLTVDGHIRKNIYVPSHIHLNVSYLLEGDESDLISPLLSENKDVKWINIDDVTKYSSEKWMNDNIYDKLNKKLKEFISENK